MQKLIQMHYVQLALLYVRVSVTALEAKPFHILQ